MRESGKTIGICTSIVAPYRLKADISNIETAAKFICRLDESAKKPENLQKYRATIPEFSIKNNEEFMDLESSQIITLRINRKTQSFWRNSNGQKTRRCRWYSEIYRKSL